MGDIKLQLQRLQRNYDRALEGYDEISLMELAHSVRLVIEAKDALIQHSRRFTTAAFQIGRPIGRVNALVRGHEYVMCFMPGGIMSRVNPGANRLGRIPVEPRHARNVVTAISAKGNPPHVEMERYCVVFHADNELARLLSTKESVHVSHVQFSQYLQGEAVRVAFQDHRGEYDTKAISREKFAKVVANTLGGSHSHQDALQGHENQFAEAVHHLMKFEWGGFPLPYFVVMKMAQDILAP